MFDKIPLSCLEIKTFYNCPVIDRIILF